MTERGIIGPKLFLGLQAESVSQEGEFTSLNARDKWGKIWKVYYVIRHKKPRISRSEFSN